MRRPVVELVERVVTPDEAGAVLAWSYEPPFDFYDLSVRAAVAAFNERSLRLCTAAGFRTVRVFDGPDDRRFVELDLELDRSDTYASGSR